MDLSRIKHFIKRNGDRVLIVENGEPEMVLMSFEEYEKMADVSGARHLDGTLQMPSAASPMSEDFGFLKETRIMPDPFESSMRSEERMAPEPMPSPDSQSMPRRIEEVRLEDLPL